MKKILVHLESGRLCDIVEAGSEFVVSSGLQWFDAPDDVNPSTHEFDGVSVAAKPPKPLPDVQAAARAKLIAARNAEITGGFLYLGKIIDSDRDSVMSITGSGVAALSAKSAGLPYNVTWTCADDSTLVLDADGVLGMVVALAMFADAQHAKARPLKDAIKNAKTPDDVGKVVW